MEKMGRHVMSALEQWTYVKDKVDRSARDRGTEWADNEVCAVVKAGDHELDITYGELVKFAGVKLVVGKYWEEEKEAMRRRARTDAEAQAARLIEHAKSACPLCAAGEALDMESGKHRVSNGPPHGMVYDKLRCLAYPWRRAAQFLTSYTYV